MAALIYCRGMHKQWIIRITFKLKLVVREDLRVHVQLLNCSVDTQVPPRCVSAYALIELLTSVGHYAATDNEL